MPEGRLGAFVCFVDDEQIPGGGEDGVVFVEFAADGFGAAQVLHGGKVDVADALLPVEGFEVAEGFSFVFGAVAVGREVVEDFAEVLKPAAVDDGAVRQDECPCGVEFARDLEGRKGFAKAHFGIPEHLRAVFEALECFVDGFALLGAEDDGAALRGDFVRAEGLAPFFDGFDGLDGGAKIGFKPFGAAVRAVPELFAPDAGAEQNLVHFFVVEVPKAFPADVQGGFGVEEFVADAGGFGVLIDALAGGVVEDFRVRAQCDGVDLIIFQAGLADFQAVGVCLIIDPEDVDQGGLGGFKMSQHEGSAGE